MVDAFNKYAHTKKTSQHKMYIYINTHIISAWKGNCTALAVYKKTRDARPKSPWTRSSLQPLLCVYLFSTAKLHSQNVSVCHLHGIKIKQLEQLLFGFTPLTTRRSKSVRALAYYHHLITSRIVSRLKCLLNIFKLNKIK